MASESDDVQLHDDNGDALGSRTFFVRDGLITSPSSGLLQALAVLTPAELARAIEDRVVIEQARGMLMFVYDICADDALELLRWRSQESGVDLCQVAERLRDDFLRMDLGEFADLRSACDDLLMIVRPDPRD